MPHPARNLRVDLTRGAVGLLLARLTAPMVVGILAMLGFNMVDTYFVGQLGTVPLAAMATTFPIVMVVTSLGLGLSVSTSLAVSRAIGAGHDARRLTTDALSLGMVLVLGFAGLGMFGLEHAVRWIGGHDETLLLALRYLRIWLFGLPFIFTPMIGNMAIRATGDTLTPGALMVVWIAVNAILDPILIFGWGPIPAMGIAGAAWATVMARVLSALVVLGVLHWREHLLTSPLTSPAELMASWRLLLRNAVPISLNNLIAPVMLGVLTRLASGFGDAAVAGLGVATRVQSFGMTLVFALQSVIGVYIGQNVGAQRQDRVTEGIGKSMAFGLGWGTCLWVVLMLVGDALSRAFNSDPRVVEASGLACRAFCWSGQPP